MATEKKEIIISISADTKSAIKNSKDAQRAVEEVTKGYEKSASSVRDLTKLIKQYQSEAIKAGESSPIGQAFLQRAGQLQDRLSDLRATVKAMGSDTAILQGFTQAASGIAAGFSIAQSAAALFGKENEDVQKALLKVQAAMGIVQGLTAIQNALQKESFITQTVLVISQRAYNAAQVVGAAVMSTYNGAIKLFTGQMTFATAATNILNVATKALMGPIGIIIAAITAIGVAVLLLKDKFSSVDGAMLRGLEIAKLRGEAARKELADVEGMSAQLKLQGKSEREILEIKKKKTEEVLFAAQAELEMQIRINKAQVENAQKNKEILKGIINFINAPLVGLLKGIDLIGDAFGKQFGLADKFSNFTANLFFDPAKTKKEGDESVKTIEQTIKELKEKRAELQLGIQDIDKAAGEKNKERQMKELEDKLKFQDDLLKAEMDFQKKLKDAREKAAADEQKRRDEINAKQANDLLNRFQRIQQNEQEIKQFTETSFKQTLTRTVEQNEERRQQIVLDLIREKQLRITNGEEKAVVEEEINVKIKEVNDAAKRIEEDAELAHRKQLRDIAIDGIENTLSSLKVIAQDNAEGQKAVAIAQGLINTYQGATKAFATYPPPLNFIAAGAVTAAGLLQVQKIANTDIPGFAISGLVKPQHGTPIRRSNGDNRLATIKTGEVVLNETHQRRLGGASTFRKIGVPGFASGGFVDGGATVRSLGSGAQNIFDMTQAFRIAANQIPAPIIGVREFQRVADKVAKIDSSSEH